MNIQKGTLTIQFVRDYHTPQRGPGHSGTSRENMVHFQSGMVLTVMMYNIMNAEYTCEYHGEYYIIPASVVKDLSN